MGPYAFVAVGLGAAFGAWLRWWLGLRLNPLFPTLPLGTLTANLVGGYLIGMAIAFFDRHTALPAEVRLFAVTGFMGALTTFSTFSAEIVSLIRQQEYLWALVSSSIHLFGSLLLTGLGILTVTLAYQLLSPPIAEAGKADHEPHASEPAAIACPFCDSEGAILRNGLAYARFDRNPVSPGHMLILPLRHVSTWSDASPEERAAMLSLVDEAKRLLGEQRAPDGYSIGLDVGEAAGQTWMHLHLHLIPRYRGDLDNSRSGAHVL